MHLFKLKKRKPTVLFHRDFKSFTGGHLKVWDYFQHIKSSRNFRSEIFFTPQSSWINNPWQNEKNNCQRVWNPRKSDILFLAGLDWLALSEQQRESPPVPVINFIQHVRHADEDCPLYQFLKYPATRICVSQEVADAIIKTGRVNGPVFVNTNGIDHSLLPKPIPPHKKDIPLLIVGLKKPELAIKIAKEFNNIECYVIRNQLSRKDFLSFVNRARTTLFLPNTTEGFYLPALEAMILKSLVICPDCIGNRSFCINNITCFHPRYSTSEIIDAVKTSVLLDKQKCETLINQAFLHARYHTLSREKNTFLKILSSIKKV